MRGADLERVALNTLEASTLAVGSTIGIGTNPEPELEATEVKVGNSVAVAVGETLSD